MSSDLIRHHCAPCREGEKPLSPDSIAENLSQIPGWQLSEDGKWISKSWKRADFADALAFVNQIGSIAETEGHHPDIEISGYRNVKVSLSTHAIGGLSENDFIVSAKIDAIAP